MRGLVSTPVKEYLQFEAALSLLVEIAQKNSKEARVNVDFQQSLLLLGGEDLNSSFLSPRPVRRGS